MNLVLIGGGALALEVLSFISSKRAAVTDAAEDIIYVVCPNGNRAEDLRRVYANLNMVRSIAEIDVPGGFEGLVCVGDATARLRLFREYDGCFSRWASVIHPSANIMPSAQIGEGVIIAPGAYVGPLAKIGDNVLVNVGASIGHDANIGHSSVISPQAAINGFAECGSATFVGAAAALLPSASLGSHCKLSAGSVFSGCVTNGFLLHGNPAKGRQMFSVE